MSSSWHFDRPIARLFRVSFWSSFLLVKIFYSCNFIPAFILLSLDSCFQIPDFWLLNCISWISWLGSVGVLATTAVTSLAGCYCGETYWRRSYIYSRYISITDNIYVSQFSYEFGDTCKIVCNHLCLDPLHVCNFQRRYRLPQPSRLGKTEFYFMIQNSSLTQCAVAGNISPCRRVGQTGKTSHIQEYIHDKGIYYRHASKW